MRLRQDLSVQPKRRSRMVGRVRINRAGRERLVVMDMEGVEMKPTGYIVFETCNDYEQSLALLRGDGLPSGGVLYWREDGKPCAVFQDRASAKAAIERTEHYRLAFGRKDIPERSFCVIVPVAQVCPPTPAEARRRF